MVPDVGRQDVAVAGEDRRGIKLPFGAERSERVGGVGDPSLASLPEDEIFVQRFGITS